MKKILILTIGEMPIKTTVAYYLTLVRVAVTKKQVMCADKNVKKREVKPTVGRNVNSYSHYGKQYGVSSKKFKLNYYVIQQPHH
jgi:hypothetical protein